MKATKDVKLQSHRYLVPARNGSWRQTVEVCADPARQDRRHEDVGGPGGRAGAALIALRFVCVLFALHAQVPRARKQTNFGTTRNGCDGRAGDLATL
jgi:hypothetical protein